MVASYAKDVFVNHEIFITDRNSLNVCSKHSVRSAILKYTPEVVLHLAAATDVDRCEQDHEYAFSVNAIGTENIAQECRRNNTKLIYVSTGAVFNGDKCTPYNEFDVPSPLNMYGVSKLAGEKIVQELVREHLVIRAGWIFGGSGKDKKFVGKIVSMINSGSKRLKAVDDKIGTPTYAKDFLEGVLQLLNDNQYGLFHIGNEGRGTRFQIAQEIVRVLGVNIEIQPVSSKEFLLPAPRGNSEAICNFKLKLYDYPAKRTWQSALEEYIINTDFSI